MNKEEFLNELQESLLGEVSETEIRDSLDYYGEYINQEISDGKSEEDVMAALGGARLIARSIIDAYQEKETHRQPFYTEEVTYDEDNQRVEMTRADYGTDLKSNAKRVLIIVAVIAALVAVGVLIVQLLPVIFAIILVLIIMRNFRK